MIIDTPETEPEAAPYSSEHEIVLLKPKEVASRWRITPAKVNQMRVAGQLKAIRLPSGTFRYDLEEILRLEKPVLPSRQTEKARSAEAIKRGPRKAQGLPGSNHTCINQIRSRQPGLQPRRGAARIVAQATEKTLHAATTPRCFSEPL